MNVTRLAIPTLLLSGAACMSLQSVGDPASFISASNPQVIFVTHRNGSLLTLVDARVSGDTLLGTRRGLSRPVALPLAHVQRVEVVRRDRRRTTLAIAGAGAVALTLGYLIAQPSVTGKTCDYTNVTHPLSGCEDTRPGH